MGRRLVLVLGLLVGLLAARDAAARPAALREVRVETTPPGATIYVDDTEAGARGTSPATLRLPVGEATLIVELEGYQVRFEAVTVVAPKRRRDRKRPQVVRLTLEPAVARLRVETPAGARVLVDGDDVGEVPVDVEVEAGAHAIQVVAAGRAPFETYVDVPGGEDLVVVPELGPAEPEAPPDEPPPEEPPPEAPPAAAPPAPWLTASVGYQFGWRDVSYQAPRTPMTLLPFTQRGAAVLRAEVEATPLARSRTPRLRPLALALGLGLGLPQDVVAASLGPIDTTWFRLAAELRYRVPIAGRHAVVLAGGVLDERYRFAGAAADVALVPDASYLSLRAQVGVALAVGPAAVTLAVDGRQVLRGGAWPGRFGDAAAATWGASAAAWVPLPHALRLGAELAYARTRWAFTGSGDGLYDADGALDRIGGVTLRLGRAF